MSKNAFPDPGQAIRTGILQPIDQDLDNRHFKADRPLDAPP